MKPKLPRNLLWTDKKSIEEFLISPFNQKLYELYMDMDSGMTQGKIAPYKVFNEAYYQCTKAVYYNMPYCDNAELELDIKANLGTKLASRTVFRLMYAILASRDNNTKEIEQFKEQFDVFNFIMTDNKAYLDFLKQKRKRNGRQYIDLRPKPCSVKGLNYLAVYWPEVTQDFDLEAIKLVTELWNDADDKLRVIDMIEEAYRFVKSGKDSLRYSFERTVGEPKRKNVTIDLSELKEEIRDLYYRNVASEASSDFYPFRSNNIAKDIEIENLRKANENMAALIEKLKAELNRKKSKKQQERSFTLGMILNYCENHTTSNTAPFIIGMLNLFLRDAGNSTQEERDSVDQMERKMLHPNVGDQVQHDKNSFGSGSSYVNFEMPENVDYTKFFAALPEELQQKMFKKLITGDNG